MRYLLILDAEGRPWPALTLLDVAKMQVEKMGSLLPIIERLSKHHPTPMRRSTGLLDTHGKPIYREI